MYRIVIVCPVFQSITGPRQRRIPKDSLRGIANTIKMFAAPSQPES